MRVSLCIAMLLLAGCASTYQVPTTPPPPLWSGNAGMVPLPDTLKTMPGDLAEGDSFLSVATDRDRTGVINGDIAYKGPFGGDVVIPAGTKVYGAQYSLMVGSTYSPMTNANRVNNPIEWCTAPETGPVRCMFWQNENQVMVIDASGPPLIEFMYSASGMPAPMPSITEQQVDFGVTVSMNLRIVRLRKNYVSIGPAMVRSDGSSRSLGDENLTWNAERKAYTEFLGGRFEFTALGDPEQAPTGVRVAVLTPPTSRPATLDDVKPADPANVADPSSQPAPAPQTEANQPAPAAP